MIKWFRGAKLSQQLSIIACLCVLIPTLFLAYSMFTSLQSTAISTRQQEARFRCDQMAAQAGQMAEVCNMSTQVFLNTPDLVEHLVKLKKEQPIDSLSLVEFFREDIASLEKIVLSNPNLYQIRVYAQAENINEMMPILYSARRMERMPWTGAEKLSGSWYLDFDDRLFDDYPVTHHVMSLVTDITTSEDGRVGVVEVSARMDEMLPELFSGDDKNFSVLLDESGNVTAGICPIDEAALRELSFTEAEDICRLNGTRVLVNQVWLKDFGCRYVQITSLADLDAMAMSQTASLAVTLVVVFVILAVAASWMTRQLLRGFYGTFDGIRAFANGDIDATVTVTGEGEVADFAREAQGLLDKIRHLMHDNLEREMQARNSEIRALQNQINAHFIYNVLEAIKMMAEIDERYDIADAVTSLGKLLRYSMKWESGNVRLKRELDYIENYIALMNLRFDYVIRLDMDIPGELMDQRLPKVSLQPIVENAVVHGAAVLAADTTVSVRGQIQREQNRYTIRITDEGKGMDMEALEHLRRQISGEEPTPSSSGNGIGLHNVQERIIRSFGPDFGLQVSSQPGQGTTVTVTLPFHEKKDGENK
ncbi:MAG: sensor histidine kinase [Oscillospiraceae bacterium]|nr:sensor histidine kinase [Oscillospiraceae bacterium]